MGLNGGRGVAGSSFGGIFGLGCGWMEGMEEPFPILGMEPMHRAPKAEPPSTPYTTQSCHLAWIIAVIPSTTPRKDNPPPIASRGPSTSATCPARCDTRCTCRGAQPKCRSAPCRGGHSTAMGHGAWWSVVELKTARVHERNELEPVPPRLRMWRAWAAWMLDCARMSRDMGQHPGHPRATHST